MIDVLVIGAGLAGLQCARVLARGGRTVQVVEASDDIGGRVRTDVIDGSDAIAASNWSTPRTRTRRASSISVRSTCGHSVEASPSVALTGWPSSVSTRSP